MSGLEGEPGWLLERLEALVAPKAFLHWPSMAQFHALVRQLVAAYLQLNPERAETVQPVLEVMRSDGVVSDLL